MNRDFKLNAGALALALEWEFADLKEIIEWADKYILRSDAPELEIIDLSLSKNTMEAIRYLNIIKGPFDKWTILRKFFGRFKETHILSVKNACDLSWQLYKLIEFAEYVPKDLKQLTLYSDDFDLALNGINGTPEFRAAELLKDIKRLSI